MCELDITSHRVFDNIIFSRTSAKISSDNLTRIYTLFVPISHLIQWIPHFWL
ncbi:hypothetical protein HanIR_Chr02g0064431 [Helianthus annuus]|nr:hypothetical protein HanIR_Chr02g0064431 [Helianthus annuus]